MPSSRGAARGVTSSSTLAGRVRAALAHLRRVEERRMFGGVAFLVNGKLCVAAGTDRLMCRIDPAIHDAVLRRKGCRAVVMRGRSYRGYVHVDRAVLRGKRDLERWIGLALDYNGSAKPAARRRAT